MTSLEDLSERLHAAARMTPRRIRDVLAVARSVATHLPPDGDGGWQGVCRADDARLQAAFRIATAGHPPATVHKRRSLLKAALAAAVGDVDAARRRWPGFWTWGRADRCTTGREITPANVLPHALYRPRGDADDPETLAQTALFRRLARQLAVHSGMRRPSSMRKALAFLHAFLFGDPGGLGLRLATAAFVDPLRAQRPADVLAAYGRWRAGRPPVRLASLTRHLHLLSVVFHGVLRTWRRPLSPTALGLPATAAAPGRARAAAARPGPAVHPDAADHDDDADDDGRFSLATLSQGAAEAADDDGGSPAAAAWAWAAATVVRPDGPRQEDRVHTFGAAEIRALYLACDTPFERVLLTALFTTGMRINGFCSLAWPAGGRVGAEVHGVEKGNVYAGFGVSSVLQTLLQRWVDESGRRRGRPPGGGGGEAGAAADPPPRYLFPNRDHPDTHLATSTARRAFHRVARRAGVAGAHVHPHTCRDRAGLPPSDRREAGPPATRWRGPCTRWGTAWSRWRGSWGTAARRRPSRCTSR